MSCGSSLRGDTVPSASPTAGLPDWWSSWTGVHEPVPAVGLVIWIPGLRPETTFLRSEPPFLGFVVMLLTISRVRHGTDECVAAPGSCGVSRRGS